jgi:hypothetical protein
MLASAEPEAMKSTAAMVALKAIGDPSAFLELNSTTEYIDLYRDCTSLPIGGFLYFSKLTTLVVAPPLVYVLILQYLMIWIGRRNRRICWWEA